MRRIRGTVVLTVLSCALVGTACGGDERRPARSPRPAQRSTTSTTSAALTTTPVATSTTTTTSATMVATKSPAASASTSTSSTSPSTNATTMNAATRPPVTTASAVMRVTTARCDRAAACNDVGTNRAYGDRDECVNEIGHDVVAAISSEACPLGVDADSLAACISDVQAEPCGDKQPAASQGPSSCAREQLCARSF